MAERLGLSSEIRELKLGPTFTNKSTAFHTLKYDFKPASVDVSKIAMVDVGENNTMTVTVPHLDGAGIPHTIFKGSQRPYHKECVLIIDRVTGEVTLERLSSNIQVKKTRTETKSQGHLNPQNSNSGLRPINSLELRTSPTHGRNKSRTKVSTGKKREPAVQLHPKTHSPFRASPYNGKSPSSNNNSISRSPAQLAGQSTLASLPIIGVDNDESSIAPPVPVPTPITAPISTLKSAPKPQTWTKVPEITKKEALSESSSSSSSSDSSDSESDDDSKPDPAAKSFNSVNESTATSSMNMPDILLNDDLQLSETESDSD